MTVILDARKLDEKQAAHEYLKEMFGFPDYYGCNLDALYDCLTDLDELDVHILHAGEANQYYPKVLSVFEDIPDAKIRQIFTRYPADLCE